MRGGRLHQVIMHKLSERPHSGYSLCKEISQITGHRPSFGSIYPLLDGLSKAGMVTVRKEGRKKIYTLTPQGKAEAKLQREQYADHIGKVVEEMKLFCEVTGQDPGPIIQFFQRFKEGENPLGPAASHAIRFRDTLFTVALDGRAKRNNKELIRILDDARTKMERLK